MSDVFRRNSPRRREGAKGKSWGAARMEDGGWTTHAVLAILHPRLRISSRLRVFAVICFIALTPAVHGQSAASATDDLPPRLDEGVARGLAFLARQQEADGAFDGGGPRVAMTSLSVMAFLSAGHTPDVGQYGATVRSAVDYLVAQSPTDGYFGKLDGSRMYGHGITTLALAEAAGVEPDPQRREKVVAAVARAVRVIIDAQDVKKSDSESGGWRYEPQSVDSDVSLSGWNALALRAAQNVGVEVPKDRAARAAAFVLRCFHKEKGGFGYQPGQDASVAMTGVAVLNLYLLDGAERPELPPANRFLAGNLVTENTRFATYAAYYATQAAHQAGGATWAAVWPATMDRLLAAQMSDGGWPASKASEEPGRVYSTSMNVLTLAVPYRLLPIYQR